MAVNKYRPLPKFTPLDIARFWSRVTVGSQDACWLWSAGHFSTGNGAFQVGGKCFGASRLAYFLFSGNDPMALEVCHSCDVRYPIGDITYRGCCNPKHLWLGTGGDNIRDACKKGRMATGIRTGAYTHPERLRRGDNHPIHLNPSLIPHGEHNKMAKLTSEMVIAMRELRRQGHTKHGIARQFNMSMTQTSRILDRKSWGHLP